MKHLTGCLLVLVCFCASAQQKPTDLDKSPMDMNYFPANYPILKMNGKVNEAPVARVIYSRPQKNNRQIFGGIVKYGEVWRMGANEATEIEFFRSVKLNNKTIPKGRYTLYAICNSDSWTIILNQEKDVWGLYYNEKKDIARHTVPVQKSAESVEALTMYFEPARNGANLNVLWDDVKVAVPFSF